MARSSSCSFWSPVRVTTTFANVQIHTNTLKGDAGVCAASVRQNGTQQQLQLLEALCVSKGGGGGKKRAFDTCLGIVQEQAGSMGVARSSS
jgi:hypothetical protein